MSQIERALLEQRGLLSSDGRRVFVTAAGRLDMDVVHTAYVMDQATVD